MANVKGRKLYDGTMKGDSNAVIIDAKIKAVVYGIMFLHEREVSLFCGTPWSRKSCNLLLTGNKERMMLRGRREVLIQTRCEAGKSIEGRMIDEGILGEYETWWKRV